jgi:hypothetical protein
MQTSRDAVVTLFVNILNCLVFPCRCTGLEAAAGCDWQSGKC